MSHVTVIGAGIVGINCAIALRKSGHDVTVVDRLLPGDGCSFGNAGILATSGFEPLAGPDTLLKVPGWLLNPDSPLFVQWRHLPRLMPWLLQYARAGMFGDFNAACEALFPLVSPSRDLYIQLAAEAGAPELVSSVGGLYAYQDEKKFRKARDSFRRRRDRGFAIQELDHNQIKEREPSLSPAYKWAYFADDYAHVTNPKRLVDVLAEYARSLGVTIQLAEVLDITVGADGPAELITDQGTQPLDKLVIAAGAFSHYLCAKFGDKVPLETERGYHVMIKDPGAVPSVPVMDNDIKAWITPMEEGLRCAGTVELASLDAPENHRRAKVLLKLAKRMVPSLNTEDYSIWMGRRPTLPDSLPVIGPATKVTNVFYAFGHHHLGLTGAPATANLIAELVAGRNPNRDIAAYRVNRF
jgi:glycine/D-amino acid oxidase-like deaminating enzyme